MLDIAALFLYFKYEQNVKVRESQTFFTKTIDKRKKLHIIVTVSTREVRVLKQKGGLKDGAYAKKTSGFKGNN